MSRVRTPSPAPLPSREPELTASVAAGQEAPEIDGSDRDDADRPQDPDGSELWDRERDPGPDQGHGDDHAEGDPGAPDPDRKPVPLLIRRPIAVAPERRRRGAR